MLMKEWENNLDTSLAIYHVSDMDWLDRTHARTTNDPFSERSAEGYTKLDLVIRKSFKLTKTQIDYSLILQNIGGSHWDYTRTVYDRNEPTEVRIPGSQQDTRAYFELAFKFK